MVNNYVLRYVLDIFVSTLYFKNHFYNLMKLIVYRSFYRNSNNIANRLQIYTIIAMGVTTLAGIFNFIHKQFFLFYIFFYSMKEIQIIDKIFTIIEVIILAFALIVYWLASKKVNDENRLKFEEEKKWFWRRFQLLVVFACTWPFEAFVSIINDFELVVIEDLSILLSSIMIFMIFVVGREDVIKLINEKYKSCRNKGEIPREFINNSIA